MSAFSRFVTRAHRRRIAWRSIEHAATGLLIGCIVALVLLIAAWSRQVDAIGPVVTILVVASIAGLVASAWRSPTLIDTARLIETQLDAPELLSSAMLASKSSDPSFVDALCALADSHVAGVTPSMLVLRRLGSRAWSGIGLATASVIVVALMISTPGADRQAVAKSSDPIDNWMNDRALPQAEKSAAGSAVRPVQRDPSSSDATTDAITGKSSGGIAQSSQTESVATADSGGNGSAKSDSRVPAADTRAANSSAMDSGTLIAGGAGVASDSGTAGANDSRTASSSNSSSIAPWTTDRWPRDREAAMDAIRSGAVPDPYRTLVQDYFQR